MLCSTIVPFLLYLVSAASGEEIAEDAKIARKMIDDRNWYCGTSSAVKWAAWSAMLSCFGGQHDFNHCCAIHDDCYEQQLGQEKCDEDFCACNWKLVEEVYLNPACLAYPKVACELVKSYGVEAYELSSFHNVTVPLYLLKEDEKISKIYPLIYDNCKLQNSTFSSCAYNFDTCVQNEWLNCNDKTKMSQLGPFLMVLFIIFMTKIQGVVSKSVYYVRLARAEEPEHTFNMLGPAQLYDYEFVPSSISTPPKPHFDQAQQPEEQESYQFMEAPVSLSNPVINIFSKMNDVYRWATANNS